MKKLLLFTPYAALIGWIVISYLNVIMNNCSPAGTVAAWNFFNLF